MKRKTNKGLIVGIILLIVGIILFILFLSSMSCGTFGDCKGLRDSIRNLQVGVLFIFVGLSVFSMLLGIVRIYYSPKVRAWRED